VQVIIEPGPRLKPAQKTQQIVAANLEELERWLYT
jgi:hypothetical protein